MAACLPYLREQIELVRPKVLLAMGTTAVRGLLGVGGITRIRGRWKLYQGNIPVMPTFHPAYLLRNEAAKRDVWNDLKEVLRHLNREVPTRGQ
jgi:DNA polymerase